MTRPSLVRALFISLFVCHACTPPARAKEQWTSVQSKNFFLAGNANEKDLRRVAVKLEQFRSVFAQLFPRTRLNSPVPMRVIVFKDKRSYVPFMPVYQGKVSEVAGYFQPGEDVNYITLTAELGQVNPYGTIFHEFVHSLLNDNTFPPPVWFNEGLAEFYSSFEVSDGDRRVTLGKPLAPHVFRLREAPFLPLARLFAINHGDPEYNERDKKGVFYAESWALVHYLMLGNGGQRQAQFTNYLGLLNGGAALGEAFQTAFQTDFATMEKELRGYIARNSYPIQVFTMKEKLEFDATLQAAPLSEAEGQYYLGDLLLHQRRSTRAGTADCETYLQNAIQLDPSFAPAHAALGLAKMYAKQFGAAKIHLQRALELRPQNHLINYYYAFMLSEELAGEARYISDIPAPTAEAMRKHLRQTIKLAPAFAEAYRLLALVYLVTGEQLDDAVTHIKSAIQLTPGREEFGYLLAQLYLRQQKFDDARKLLEPLAQNAAEPQMRAQARSMLETVQRMAEQIARYSTPPEEVNRSGEEKHVNVRPVERRRFEGERAEGTLTRVDCTAKGITLTVKLAGNRTMQFHSTTPERVQFVTYTQEVSAEITCGVLKPAPRVAVTYRTSTDAKFGFDGEPIAVEFVKP